MDDGPEKSLARGNRWMKLHKVAVMAPGADTLR